MEFRKADMDDIKVLAQIRKKQLIDEGQDPDIDIDEKLNRFFERQMKEEKMIEWIAIEDEKIVGTAAIMFLDFPPSFSNEIGIRAYITNMYTDPSYRRRGIASTLLNKLIEEAKQRNITHIFLSASKQGMPVYEKCGFKAKDSWMEYEG
ncbi:MAG: GNAT family N-acetyltransferase [Erysipelotrichaceae bacterium]|nr:GNAT family N-acetyltransferase [Erysipelotrichaceae bacterium]